MRRRTPRFTRTDPLFPYPTLFRFAPDRRRLAKAPQGPGSAAEDALHAEIRDGNDVSKAAGESELDHAGEEFVGRRGDPARGVASLVSDVERKPAALT